MKTKEKILNGFVKVAAKGIYHSPNWLLKGTNRLFDPLNKYSSKLDPDVKTAIMALNKFVSSDFVNNTPEEARGILENDSGLAVSPKNDNIEIKETQIGRLKTVCAIPKNAKNDSPVIFYLHGGGWVLGSAANENDTLKFLSENTKSIVLSLDYPLAPENSYTDMLETISEVCDIVMDEEGFELFGKNYKPRSFGMSGDSAGGHLTTAVNIFRIKNNKRQVDIQIPLVPVTDLNDFETESYKEFEKGYYLTKAQMVWYRKYFTNDNKENWIKYSPYHEDRQVLKKLSKTHIVSAECDVLNNDGKKYYQLLKDLGVDASFEVAKGQLHIFPAAPYMWKGAKREMLKISDVFNSTFYK